jgi:hypothetical protein
MWRSGDSGKLKFWHASSPQPDTRKPSFSTSHYRYQPESGPFK